MFFLNLVAKLGSFFVAWLIAEPCSCKVHRELSAPVGGVYGLLVRG